MSCFNALVIHTELLTVIFFCSLVHFLIKETPSLSIARSYKVHFSVPDRAETFLNCLLDTSMRKWRCLRKPEKNLRQAILLRRIILKITDLKKKNASKKRRLEVKSSLLLADNYYGAFIIYIKITDHHHYHLYTRFAYTP